MRMVVAVVTLLSCAIALPARAQDRDDTGRSVTKIVIGAAALAVGVTVAAKSSQTTTVSTVAGTSETSTFSTSQLVTGLAVAGVGGIVLWDGVRSHDRTRPSTLIGVATGRGVRAVCIRRVW
jgi:hypothetical protein